MKNPFAGRARKAKQSPGYWKELVKAKVAEDVSELMDERGMNRTALAKKLGCSVPRVSAILRGDSNFTINSLVEIFAVFGKVPKIVASDRADYWPRQIAIVCHQVSSGQGMSVDHEPGTVDEDPAWRTAS